MTIQEMIELIQQHHPHIGETEAIRLLNRAKDDFCTKSELIKDSYTSQTVADQRYYTLDQKIFSEIEDKIGKTKIIDKEFIIKNIHRAVGTRISYHLYKTKGYK